MPLQAVFLMVVLRVVERFQGQHRRGELLSESFFQGFFRRVDNIQLVFVAIPDRGPVLTAAHSANRVVRLPDQVDDRLAGNLRRIKLDLERLGVILEIVIGRKFLPAAGVTDSRAVDAFDDPKLGVGSPKSPEGKGRNLQVFRDRQINRWNGDRNVRVWS